MSPGPLLVHSLGPVAPGACLLQPSSTCSDRFSDTALRCCLSQGLAARVAGLKRQGGEAASSAEGELERLVVGSSCGGCCYIYCAALQGETWKPGCRGGNAQALGFCEHEYDASPPMVHGSLIDH